MTGNSPNFRGKRLCLACHAPDSARADQPFCIRCWQRVSRGAKSRLNTVSRKRARNEDAPGEYLGALARCKQEARRP